MNHRRILVAGLVLGGTALWVGCDRKADAPASAPKTASVLAVGSAVTPTPITLAPTAPPAPAEAGPSKPQSGGGGANPIENYKQARMKEALRGLKYDTGVVTLDPEQAPAIAQEVAGQVYADMVAHAYELLNSGLQVEAIGAFTRAVIRDPGSAPAYEGLSDALITKGRTKESQAALSSALMIDGQSASLRFKFAQNLQRAGDLPGQIAAFQRVLEVAPNHVESLSRLAIAHYFAEDYAAAWTYTHACEAAGGSVPPQFRELLASKHAEPNS